MLLVASFSLPYYWMSAAFTYAAWLLAKRKGWPPYIALVLGGVASVLAGYFYFFGYSSLMADVYPSLRSGLSPDRTGLSGGFTGYLFGPPGYVYVPIWVTIPAIYEWGARDGFFSRSGAGSLPKPSTRILLSLHCLYLSIECLLMCEAI